MKTWVPGSVSLSSLPPPVCVCVLVFGVVSVIEHFSDTLMRAEVFYSWVVSSFILKM